MNSFFEFCGNMIFLGGTMALGAFIASFIVSQTMYSKTQFEYTVDDFEYTVDDLEFDFGEELR
jgi:Kef-type K+ transport system membrane component KefB